MPRLDRSIFEQITDRSLSGFIQRVTKALNTQVSFGKTNANDTVAAPDASNISLWKATGTTPGVANTEFAITHNLQWIPWHYHYFLDVPGQLYQGPTTGTAWTAATNSTLGSVFLKCTVANANYTIWII